MMMMAAMKDTDRRAFLERAKTAEYLKKIDGAVDRIMAVRSKRCYVAFSGGKDSTAMMHLVHSVIPTAHVFHYDYGEKMIGRYFDEIKKMMMDSCGSTATYEIGKRYRSWYKDFFGVHEKNLAEKFDIAFVGIRSDESVSRRERIKENKSLGKIKEVWPIADFSATDVWAYIVSNGLEYSSFYDEYSILGNICDLRFVTFFDDGYQNYTKCTDSFVNWRHKYERQ